MKKLIVVLAFILFPISGVAQAPLDFLEDIAGVETVVITKDAFKLLLKFNPEKFKDSKEIKIFKMAAGLEEFKMFSSKDPIIAEKIAAISLEAVKKQNLTPIKTVDENDPSVKIYAKEAKNKAFVSNAVLFLDETDTAANGAAEVKIVVLKGKLQVQQISKLATIFVKKNK